MGAGAAYQITISASDKASVVAKKIEAALARVTKPIDRVTASAAKLNEATEKIKKPFSDFGSSLKRLSDETGLTRVARGVKSIGDAAVGAGKSLLSVVAPLAGIAGLGSVAGIALLANEWGRMGAEVQRTSGVLGVSTQDLQAYRSAAKLAGLSAEDMTGSLKSLGRTLEDATFGRNQDALVMMHKFGITLHRTKEGAVDATRALKEVANAIVAQKGNVQAQGLIAGVFGVESLLPLLQKGEKGINEFVNRAKTMGLVFDDKQLARGQQFNENMLKLEASATRLKYSFGEALAPAVQRVLDVVGRLIDKYGDVIATKVAEYVEKFAKWVGNVDWDKTTSQIGKFVDAIGGVKGIAIAVAAISFAGPIAGLVSIAANLALIATGAAPAAAAAIGTMGTAAIAAAAAWGALKVAKAAGLPDTDQKTGVDDVKSGKWGAASVHLPAMDFLGAAWDRLSGKTNSEIAYGLNRGAGKQTAESGELFSKLESQYGLPAGLLDSVWNTESGRGAKMNSPAGAKGHFQFMDATARQYGVTDPYDLKQSATGAAKMYSDLLKANGGDLDKALAGYNWGQGNLNSKGLQNAPKETRDYIAKVRAQMGLTSLYAGQSGQIVAANQPGSIAGASSDAGKVQVEVVFTNAPTGTKTSVKSSGNVTASVRIGSANVTGPSV
ncbi:hypothetical protein BGV72_24565 [Burkholderia ubonensis]|uniref:lytic transglycosylase domain-containing protein n=1 Tax=Burkholderia ubonensis TaxID=101571 RepID=UPI0008FDD3A0|nr:transglycosylase SLT domain-containing protein [Burkholderia ubonensis]OJA74528.1 hypothetical protein BGV72_24565 [Burkholderia ubonensis]